jgi:hypothetical protein
MESITKTIGENSNKIYRISKHNAFYKVDDFLFGSGKSYIREPNLAFVCLLRDESPVNQKVILEGYFNDLYKLFVRKLSEFDCMTRVRGEDGEKLLSLLEELIKVKNILVQDAGKLDSIIE